MLTPPFPKIDEGLRREVEQKLIGKVFFVRELNVVIDVYHATRTDEDPEKDLKTMIRLFEEVVKEVDEANDFYRSGDKRYQQLAVTKIMRLIEHQNKIKRRIIMGAFGIWF